MGIFLQVLKSILLVISLFTAGFVFANNQFPERIKIVALEEENLPALKANCEKNYVEVLYDDPVDYEIACEGIEKAENFVKNHLLCKENKKTETSTEKDCSVSVPKGPIKILFGDATMLKDQLNGEPEEIPNIGIYQPREGVVVVSPLKSQQGKTYFEAPVTRGILKSVVVHEVIHRIHHLNTERLQQTSSNEIKIHSVAREILAYIAQIDTMDPKKKEFFLSSTEDKNFDYRFGNLMRHLHFFRNDPNSFAVNAYRYWRKNNSSFAVEIFRGEWTPSYPINAWEKKY